MSSRAGQVAEQLEQLLENYARCGLHHIPRIAVDQLPPKVIAALGQSDSAETATAAASPAVSSAVSDSQTSAAEPATTQSRTTEKASTTPAAPRPTAAPAAPRTNGAAAAPQGKWELPVLDNPERMTRLSDLELQVRQCRKCEDIISYRQQTVFGTGPVNPRICFVGEAPGADEDRLGEPFVGRAGQLLTKIIGAMKLKREEVYILNALKCRPPQNRTPVPDEIESCRHFIESQLEILQPEFIVCLGAVAARSLLRTSGSIGSMRGSFLTYKQARVVVTYHPSYLLRNENAKRLVWDDMQMLMAEL